MCTRLIKAYTNVFADTLVGSNIKVEKMNEGFVENLKMPNKAYTAKEPPIHWRPQARTLLQDLIKQGIITEVIHQTDFCARTNFVT